MGISGYRAMPLGPQSLPQEFAMLSFATLGAKPHLRLCHEEVLERCPWLPMYMANAPHCLDHVDVLELVRVDLGGPADHVARKSATDLANRCRIREFPAMIADQRFRLVVITSTIGKASAIKRALDRHDLPAGLLVHFSVVPQLLSLGVNRDDA
jgi:hypothetical protein